MGKNKKLLAKIILTLGCTFLNIAVYYAVHAISADWFYISILAYIPIGCIIASIIGGRILGVLTTVLSVGSFYIIDMNFSERYTKDWRIAVIALVTMMICSIWRYSRQRKKVRANILLVLLISLANIAVNLSYWHIVYNEYYYSMDYDLYIIILVPLVVEAIIVFACFLFTKGYKAKFLSYFDSKLLSRSNENVSFPLSVKIAIAVTMIVISLVIVAVMNASNNFYNRIAQSMKLSVSDYAGVIAAPYNPGDIDFSESWEKNPETEKERIISQITNAIEMNTSANTFMKVEVVKLETNEDYEISSAKVVGTFVIYDPEEGYLDNIRYDDTEKAVDLNTITSDSTSGMSFDSLFHVYNYMDDDYYICLYMDCKEVEDIPAFVFTQVMLSLVVAILVGSIAIHALEIIIAHPLQRMTYAADNFVHVDEEQRKKAGQEFMKLNIHSHDEVASLYQAFGTAMESVSLYAKNVKKQADYISQIQHSIIITMADLVESRDHNTGGHIRRTAKYVEIIAKKLAEQGKMTDVLTEQYIENLVIAAPLHDIGKIQISDTVLNKPGRLTSEEYDIMKTHAQLGQEILEKATENLGKFDYLDIAIQVAGMHHEWWNGKGYPYGLQGEDIPICARIMAVSDVFDAIVSKRCYKDSVEFDKAFDIVVSEGGEHFDPVVIDAFIAAKEEIREAAE